MSEENEHIKDFKFYITEVGFPAVFKQKVQSTLDRLNEAVGSDSFKLVNRSNSANSFINLTKVSKYFGSHSIGAGGPIYYIKKSPTRLRLSGPYTNNKISHGMDIDIDRTWVIQNLSPQQFGIQKSPNQPSHSDRSFEVLFLHEIGHGLGMKHDSDPKSVMYQSVDFDKDISRFYDKVRFALQKNNY